MMQKFLHLHVHTAAHEAKLRKKTLKSRRIFFTYYPILLTVTNYLSSSMTCVYVVQAALFLTHKQNSANSSKYNAHSLHATARS